jgi:hypothetical protein
MTAEVTSNQANAAILRGGAVGALAGLLLGGCAAIRMAYIANSVESGYRPNHLAVEPFFHHGEWWVVLVATIAGLLLGSLGFGLLAVLRDNRKTKRAVHFPNYQEPQNLVSTQLAEGRHDTRPVTDSRRAKPDPVRPWYQYSLRTLLDVTIMSAVACSAIGYKRHVEQQRRSIQQEFQQLGGDINWDTTHWWSAAVTCARFSPNAYHHLTWPYRGDGITDDQLRQLKPRLRYVEALYLDGTEVTDRGLEYLADMKELRTLGLGSTAVTDSGVRRLAQLTRLEGLNLRATGIPDRAVAWLARCFGRQDFRVTYKSKVTDAALADLRQLTRLKWLDLGMTEITDFGLRHMETLKDLEVVDLSGTLVTEQGVKKLQQALPKCKVYWQPSTKDERQSRATPAQLGG